MYELLCHTNSGVQHQANTDRILQIVGPPKHEIGCPWNCIQYRPGKGIPNWLSSAGFSTVMHFPKETLTNQFAQACV